MTEASDRLHELFISQLRHLEERIEDQDRRIQQELSDIEQRLNAHTEETRRNNSATVTTLQTIMDRQQKSEPALNSLQNIMSTSAVMKWVVLFAVAAMAGINTIATGFEVVRGWIK